MRANETKSTGPASCEHVPVPPLRRDVTHRNLETPKCRVLLVGCTEEMQDNAMATTIHGQSFHVIGKSPTLLEGLGKLELEGVQLVVLGSEFSEEELAVFVLDARRRGFRGIALRVLGHVSQRYQFNRPTGSVTEEVRTTGNRAPAMERTRDRSSERSETISFTERETAVLTRVSSGWTNFQIAQDLKCSEGSVKGVIQQLFGKLGVRKRAQIVRMAYETGFRAPAVKHDASLES